MTQPKIIDRYLHVDQLGYEGVIRYSRRTMAPKAIFVHIQEGKNLGSWIHFHSVKASSTVLIGKNGDIWRLVDEALAPWTNGDVKSPTPKGKALIARYGSDPNLYSLTIEMEGFSGEAVPEAQMASLVWLVRDWQARYDIPNDMIFRHADVNQVTRPRCPGDALFNELMRQIAGGVPPTYAIPQPVIVDGKLWTGNKDTTLNGVVFHANKRSITTSGVLNRRQWASSESQLTGEAYALGSKIDVLGWCLGESVSGENRWWIAANGDRLWAGGSVDKPNARNEEPQQPDEIGTPLVVNGITFTPVTGSYKLTENTNVRQWASTDSKVLKTLKAGTIISPKYKVIGDKVAGVNEWFVPDDKAVKSGGRIWSGTSKPLA